MKLSLSARVAEEFHAKRQSNISLAELAELAVAQGYSALCMRASQLGVHTPDEQVEEGIRLLEAQGLSVSMLTGDFSIPENSDTGPQCLRHITPYLDLAARLGADLLRVCMKKEEDIPWARRAADEARERTMRLAHQCHTRSLFEEVEASLRVLERIGRPNFGLIYEPANLELCGQDYGPETLRRFAPHIFNVYLQNQRLDPGGASVLTTWCRGEVRFAPLPVWEQGGIDFPSIVRALEEIEYEGYITVHQAAAGGARAAAAHSAHYLRSLL